MVLFITLTGKQGEKIVVFMIFWEETKTVVLFMIFWREVWRGNCAVIHNLLGGNEKIFFFFHYLSEVSENKLCCYS